LSFDASKLKYLVFGVIISVVWGFAIQPRLIEYIDTTPSITPVEAFFMWHLFYIGIFSLAAFALLKEKLGPTKSLYAAIGGWLIYDAIDYFEAPLTVNLDGTIDTTVSGWKATIDSLAWHLFKNAGVPQNQLYYAVYVVGPIITWALAIFVLRASEIHRLIRKA